MRKLIVGLLVVLVALLAADVGARAYAESRVSAQLAASLDLSERPDVSLGGFPFLVRALSGEVPSARLVAGRFTADGVPFERFDLTLRAVTFSLSQVVVGRGSIEAGQGDGTAVMTAGQITEALHGQGIPADVRFGARDQVRISADGLPGEVGAEVSLDGNSLVLEPADLPSAGLSFRLKLPEIVRGLRYSDLHVGDQEAALGFRVGAVRFDASE